MKSKKNYRYPYNDIKKLTGQSFDVGCKEFDVMPIDELIDYLNSGWVIYHESGKNNNEIKCLALVKTNSRY